VEDYTERILIKAIELQSKKNNITEDKAIERYGKLKKTEKDGLLSKIKEKKKIKIQ
jgi:hypothetical protein